MTKQNITGVIHYTHYAQCLPNGHIRANPIKYDMRNQICICIMDILDGETGSTVVTHYTHYTQCSPSIKPKCNKITY